MTRARIAVTAAVAASAIGVTAALVVREPSLPPPPEVTYASNPIPLGSPHSVQVVLPNPDRLPVTILDVRTTVSRNAELVGVLALAPPAAGPYTPYGGPGFPPHPQAWDLSFTELPARFPTEAFHEEPVNRRHVEIVVGIRVLRGDIGALNGITVEYEIAGERKTRYFATAMLVCVAPGPCPAADTDALLRKLGVARPA